MGMEQPGTVTLTSIDKRRDNLIETKCFFHSDYTAHTLSESTTVVLFNGYGVWNSRNMLTTFTTMF